MQPFHTLHDFFVRSAAEVRLYHLGRRVEPCEMATLAALEADTAPWPIPWQGQARLGLVFRLGGDMSDPLIWFLALPLDEEGRLDPASRDAFVQRLLETLGRNVANIDREDGQAVDNLMQDNPLAFTPSLPFQAMLHARASHDLGRAASSHLEPVEAYLSGQQTLNWQALGLQGLADFTVRMGHEERRQLTRRIPDLPAEVLTSLCYCLEHVAIDGPLAAALRARGEVAAETGDLETLCACVRAASTSEVTGDWFDSLLADAHACGPDVLAAIAARGWSHLEDDQRLPHYLECLASCEQADFMRVARDLALIPRLRLPVLMTLREAPADSPIGRRLAALTR